MVSALSAGDSETKLKYGCLVTLSSACSAECMTATQSKLHVLGNMLGFKVEGCVQ